MQKKESREISLRHRHPRWGFCEKKRPPTLPSLSRTEHTEPIGQPACAPDLVALYSPI